MKAQPSILCAALLLSVNYKISDAAKCEATDPDCSGRINPCLNSGKCCLQADEPVCDCAGTGGYSGGFCQERLCVPTVEPCLNGGTCEDVDGSYFCSCLPEFNGPKCESHRCAGDPCQNGATCTAYRSTYICTCPRNSDNIQVLGGKNCELTPCTPNRCQNGGTCTVNTAAIFLYYSCTCPKDAEGNPLFYGKNCEETNPCLSSPCQNDALCTTIDTKYLEWGYVCYFNNGTLSTLWGGRNAEVPSICATGNHTCANGGACFRQPKSYYRVASNPDYHQCRCSPEWTCSKCEKPNPCVQGRETFDTRTALTTITPANDLCYNGGTCLASCAREYICRCAPGFAGPDCSFPYAKWAGCWGDPRCVTFDGYITSYQGDCQIVLTKSCDDQNWPVDIPTFQIIGDFQKCGGYHHRTMGPSCVNSTIIEINGQIIEILNGQRVIVDGVEITLPYSLENPEDLEGKPLLTIQVDIMDPVYKIGIETNWGLYVTHGRRRVDVYFSYELSPFLEGKVCGLWGNADGNKENDGLGLNQNDMYDSHILIPPRPEGCVTTRAASGRTKRETDDVENPLAACANETQRNFSLQACAIINNRTGPFAACYSKNTNRLVMYDQCLEDICFAAEFKCPYLEGYAKHCGKLTCYDDWRSVTGCPATCPEGMTYSFEANINCIPTCFNLDPCPLNGSRIIYNSTCEEGCVCEEGTVWDVKSGTCIPPEDCGTTEWGVPPHFGKECNVVEDESDASQVSCVVDQEDGKLLEHCKKTCNCAVYDVSQKNKRSKNKKKLKKYTSGNVNKCNNAIWKGKQAVVTKFTNATVFEKEQMEECKSICSCLLKVKGKHDKFKIGSFNKCTVKRRKNIKFLEQAVKKLKTTKVKKEKPVKNKKEKPTKSKKEKPIKAKKEKPNKAKKEKKH